MNAEPVVWISSLGWALVHFLWQGLLIGMISAVLLTVLRNARPQARYLAACVALLACLTLPGWEFVRGLQSDANVVVIADATPVHIANDIAPLPVVAADNWHPDLQARLPWIVSLWSIGAALLALRMALGLAWIGTVRRAHATDLDWQRRLDRIATRMGLAMSVRLHLADDLDGPVAAGWWRPIVIVPTALLARMSPELLEALLAHELAHIKRHDYLVNLAQSAVEALLFYHPVVWWLSRQIRIEREQIADDLAAHALGAPRDLALALQELDRFQLHSTQLALAASGGNLMSRIQRLIRPNVRALTWQMALPILGLTAVCLAAYANTQPIAPKAGTPVTVNAAVAPVVAGQAAPAAEPAGMAEPAVEAEPADQAEPADEAEPADDNDNRLTYALVRAGHDGMTMSGSTKDIAEVERIRKNTAGDFLWIRRDGKAYLIQDPALLESARAAWRPTEPIEAQMAALEHEMQPHEQAMDALSKQMDALDKQNRPGSDAMEKLGAQMEALGRQQEALGAQMEPLAEQMAHIDNDAERTALDRKMQALQVKMDALNQQMEVQNHAMEAQNRQFEVAQRPIEELSRKMEAASKPMEELGRKMEVLGKQEEALSKVADRQVQMLIDRAIDSGAARPINGQRAD